MTTPLITQKIFVDALSEGISIPPVSDDDLTSFGQQLIDWINATENVYWAAWDSEHANRVIMDLHNCELMQLHLNPGRLLFYRMEKDVEHTMAKEFGNGAIGVILFCMLANGELEEFELDKILNEEANQDTNETEAFKPDTTDEEDSSDFDWV
jgi:hypothetical protein|tara:strand:- start:461 stop:919 length:459 start_codon:yes stop_codon:yes gene_type:complete